MDPSNTGAQPVTPAGLLASLTYIDNVGFHGIATTLTGPDPKIDRNWAALIRNAHIAVAAITWPLDLQATASRFTYAADQLIAVLERRDTASVAEPAKELHIAYHALSDAGWSHLAAVAGITTEDAHDHHEHGHSH
ncbi:hypothetical protein ACIQC5_05250 [Paenarthrobacter sp. NPDC092416]|uniref:hypothetical protein n=1 Tax=Paenarthrobacter sp. NPDC092416 TaxID=3364386 RepID=UPI0037FB35DD